MKTLDIKQKLNIEGISTLDKNFVKAHNQDFYKSPSGKQIHLVEKLPNGDYWFIRTWNTSNVMTF